MKKVEEEKKNEGDDFLWLEGEVNFSYLPEQTKNPSLG